MRSQADRLPDVTQMFSQSGPQSDDVALLLADCARAAGQDESAAEQIAGVAARMAASQDRVRQSKDAAAAARMAWFYVEYQPDSAKALEFGKMAFDAAPADPLARRNYGLALLAAGQAEEARKVLGPLTLEPDCDQFAAWGLARALFELGDKQAALQAARDAEQLRRSGIAYQRTVNLLKELGAPPLPMPDYSKVIESLDGFDPGVLDFGRDPGKYLSLSVTPLDSAPEFGAPWRCRFVLTNLGEFPITLGPGQMVSGQVLVSARADMPDSEPIDDYVTVLLVSRHVLPPGQSVAREETVDVGPVALIATTMAQRELPVTFAATLDAPDSIFATARLTRRPVRYVRSDMERLALHVTKGTRLERVRAMRTAAGLLAERLLAMREKLDYRPARVDKKWLESLLAVGLSDPDPVVRARTLESLALLPFDNDRVQTLAPLLSDEHWLVRLLAVDVLADTQGEVFVPVCQRLADSDPDELVSELADLWLQRWEADDVRGAEAIERPPDW